ncbi:MAG: hypothetical protein HY526_04855 [Betaproteobacteria bacterium]|nr:hypothetical protein [Betaproteobacteria bacterium]
MPSVIRWALIVLVLSGAGCATQSSSPARPQVNLSGYPPAFRQGYSDGCESARTASVRRDERRYRGSSDYTLGWNDGYSVCGRRR